MKTTVTVSEKGQVTIPKRLRLRLGITPGTQLCFEEQGGCLLASRVLQGDPLDALVGMAGAGRESRAELDDMRGPAWGQERDGK